ncbi:NCK-interacting protein with SH3 domain [Clonorchis sinensis]|uniref:NCK-interacting protein with SH3 domain n=2 Tax=Clonorchis sinensis TaxID=79923 RepID=A0A8T1MGL1_CLOSI|nr:NCK-interacting protein with SH3 domain [Clonorchis sinensis]
MHPHFWHADELSACKCLSGVKAPQSKPGLLNLQSAVNSATAHLSEGMMLRSLYPYDGPFEGSLHFMANESFLKIRSENEYWFLVSKPDGTVGCVPYNYVEPDKEQNEQTIAKCARLALASINRSSSFKNKEDIIEALRKLAKDTNDNSVQPAPPLSKPMATSFRPSHKPRPPERDLAPQRSRSIVNGTSPAPAPPKATLPGGLAARLVDTLRLGTNADYADCYNSFRVMLEILACEVSDLRPHTTLLDTMLTKSTIDQRHASYRQSPDWYLLKRHLTMLEKRQNNNQECGWELHENQHQLSRHLDGLNDVLTKADPELLKFYLKSTDYRHMECLIQLYHSEHRVAVRRKLLLAIGICCSLDTTCLSVSVNSVLPQELIRELSSANSSSDVSHLAMCLRVFTLMLARTPDLPVDVRSKLNSHFITQVLRFIGATEGPNSAVPDVLTDFKSSDVTGDNEKCVQEQLFDGQLTHAATALLLACNWHFCSIAAKRSRGSGGVSPHIPPKIPLLEALLSQPTACRPFLELVVQAFNRDIDPITYVDVKPSTQSTRSKRLFRWSDVISNSASVCTDYGLELVESANIVAIFDNDTEQSDSSLCADDGQYARHIWSDGPTMRGPPATVLSLPNTLSPTTPRHSVIKLLMDLFHSMDTADLVYRNDQDVIIEVINRQLSNLTLDDSERVLDFSVLLGLLIANSDYLNRGAYRGRELMHSLEVLLQEEPTEKITSVTFKRRFECARISYSRLRSALQGK